jgi:hypothetical protein
MSGFLSSGIVNADEIPDSGISRYALEQNFVDSWGGNDGTGENSPQFTTDSAVGDYAIDFTGDEWVDIGTPTDLAFTANDAFSIAVWIEADSWSTPNDRSHWVSSRNGSSNFTAMFSLDSADFRWAVKGDSNTSIISTTPPSTGSYTLVVGTYDGAGNTELYFNNANSQGTDSASLSGDVYGYWNIGQREDLDRAPDGRVDDPRFYSKELSASEVSNLYNTGSI